MEASAINYHAPIGLHGRTPLLRLQSDERLITLLRRGNTAAFEVLVARYESRLLAFCRHLLGSREDAEDVLQEVMTAAFNAIIADDRPINARPWLYRIARNRSLNHLRKTQAIGVDSMDHHLAEQGASTADKVQQREQFRLLVGDIQDLPETQRTALVLREMDALSYEQIAEAMETTVSSVKSLLVRARVSLTEAAGARLLTCEEVRLELAAVAEGIEKRPSPLARRHLKDCDRCAAFKKQLKATNKALAALLPVGPLVVIKKLAFLHLGHSAGYGAGSAGATAAGSTASAGAGAALGASGAFGGGTAVSAGMGAVATKAAAGLAAAVIVTAGAVEVDHNTGASHPKAPVAAVAEHHAPSVIAPVQSFTEKPSTARTPAHRAAAQPGARQHVFVRPPVTTVSGAAASKTATQTTATAAGTGTTSTATTRTAAGASTTAATSGTETTGTRTATTGTGTTATSTGRTQTQTDPTTVPTTPTTPAPPLSTPTTPVAPVTSVPTTGTVTTGTSATGATGTTGTGTAGTGTAATGTTGTGTSTTGTAGTGTEGAGTSGSTTSTGTATTGTGTVTGTTGTGTTTPGMTVTTSSSSSAPTTAGVSSGTTQSAKLPRRVVRLLLGANHAH